MNALLVGGDNHGLSLDMFELVDHISILGQSYNRGSLIAIDTKAFHVYVYVGCSSLEQWEIEERIIDAMKQFSGNNKWVSSSKDEQLDYGMATCKVTDALFNDSVSVASPARNCTTIGLYADKVSGSKMRTPATVAGRTLEECVELCLASGLTTGEIYSHVTDSIHNQYVKLAKQQGSIKYPSESIDCVSFEDRQDEIAGEIGDVLCMLHDMAHVSNINIEEAYAIKLKSFIGKVESGKFYANKRGNLYVRKPHMSFNKAEVKPDDEHDARI